MRAASRVSECTVYWNENDGDRPTVDMILGLGEWEFGVCGAVPKTRAHHTHTHTTGRSFHGYLFCIMEMSSIIAYMFGTTMI